jgi:hypothetical protein
MKDAQATPVTPLEVQVVKARYHTNKTEEESKANLFVGESSFLVIHFSKLKQMREGNRVEYDAGSFSTVLYLL